MRAREPRLCSEEAGGRNAGLVGIVASVLAALTLDRDGIGSSATLTRLGLVFAAGAFVGCIGIGLAAQLPQPRRRHSRDHQHNLVRALAAPLRDVNFRRFLGRRLRRCFDETAF